MLNELKFVQRALSRKDIVPGLTHFRIQGGRVSAFNGTLAISAPAAVGFEAAPAGAHFLSALNACEDVIALQYADAKVQVRSGKFKTVVPCVPLDSVPSSDPAGTLIEPPTSILTALKMLEPFIGTDASRPWSCGVLLAGQSAFATNNLAIVEYWLGVDVPTVNIPSSAIAEIIRVKEELSALQVSDESITFHYADGRWLKTQLLSLAWPNIVGVLNQCCTDAQMYPTPPGLADACEKLAKFNDRHDVRCYLRGNDVSTTRKGLEEGGALVELGGIPSRGCYNTHVLATVANSADFIDFTKYPNGTPFFRGRLRGALVGIRVDYES